MPDTLEKVRRETRLGTQRRDVSLAPTTYNADTRTVELVAATGFRVKRWGWDGPYLEQLQISDDAIDLSRVDAGQCPLLDTHSRWSVDDQLGMLQSGRVENGALILVTKFAASERGQEIESRVAAGDLRGVSVGYRVLEMTLIGKENDIPIYEVTRWELLECSLVPVPADPDSGVRSAQEDDSHPCIINETRKVAAMTVKTNDTPAAVADDDGQRAAAPATPAATAAPAVAAPAAPAADQAEARMSGAEVLDFVDAARSAGVEERKARTWATTMKPDEARAELVKAAATRQNQDSPALAHGEAARIGNDPRDHQRTALVEVLGSRAQLPNKVTDNGRRFVGMTLMEMGREMLRANGFRTDGLNRRQLAQAIIGFDPINGRAHSSSDFPYALSAVTNKTLRGAYDGTPQTFKAWMRKTTAPDFKPINRIQLSGAPALLEVPEGGEYQYGTMTEGREIYSLVKYGRKFGLTWEMIINDDLDGFSKIPRAFGAKAAELESDVAYAPILANAVMADGNAVFSSAHANLAGSGADLSETTLQALDMMLGSQTGLDGSNITVVGKYLLSGLKWKLMAKKLTAEITATKAADINAYAGDYTPIIERRLNGGANPTPYMLIADNATIDTGEYCYLEGDEGVFLEERNGFDIDQIEYKARLVMAAKIVDFRGMAKNPGT